MGRLKFLKHNQDKLRLELYSGLVDVIHRMNTESLSDTANNIGKSLVLPSSFIGGPRYMVQLYQDAMSVVRKLSKPDLFVTFTCNPTWPEITRELLKHQIPSDRPNLIARVFKMKLDELFIDLFER